MKIYLFDDTPESEISASLNKYLDEKQDVIELICKADIDDAKEALREADAIMIHDSFIDYDWALDGLTSGGKNVHNYLVENRLVKPTLFFSGGFFADNIESREMVKASFYARLPQVVDAWLASGIVDLDLFFGKKSEPETAKENTSASIESSTDLPAERSLNAIKAFAATRDRMEINLDSTDLRTALEMPLLLRLWLPAIGEKSLMPVVVRCSQPIESYIAEARIQKLPWQLLFTRGVYINPSPEEILSPLPAEAFREEFLNSIRVLPIAKAGRHTIANDWGAFLAGLFVDAEYREGESPLSRMSTTDPAYLLFTWLNAMDDKTLEKASRGVFPAVERFSPHNFSGKRILFVDDQSELWLPVLKGLFKGAAIDVVGKDSGIIPVRDSYYVSDEAYDKIVRSGLYDLIILDVRLGGVEEERLSEGDSYSGLKILEDIMENNPGQQVVMFTASNKAWNLLAAIEHTGCTGYYIKESPEHTHSMDEVRANLGKLIKDSKKALDRAYLRDLYKRCKTLKAKLSRLAADNAGRSFPYMNGEDADSELNKIILQLDTAYNLLAMASTTEPTSGTVWHDAHTRAFIALIQLLEIFKHWRNDVDALRYNIIKIAELLGWNFNSSESNELDSLIKYRNRFIHRNPGEYDRIHDETQFLKLFRYVERLIDVLDLESLRLLIY